jgi:glucose-1-phosphate cytidylyltransferase
MKVLILCGGKGERLREETEFKPKPLIEIGGLPILWHIMKIYSHYGHKEFILLLGYKGRMIKEFFLNFELMANDFTLDLRDKNQRLTFHEKSCLEDWKITFVDTGDATMTGGRIARARHLVGDEDFMLTYGDGLANIDLDSLAATHRKQGKTLTLTGVRPMSPFGIIEVDQGIARSFREKPKLEGTVNGGFMVCKPALFDHLSPSEDCVLEEEPMKDLARKSGIAIYQHDGFWAAMDTYKQVQTLNQIWDRPSPPWKIWS